MVLIQGKDIERMLKLIKRQNGEILLGDELQVIDKNKINALIIRRIDGTPMLSEEINASTKKVKKPEPNAYVGLALYGVSYIPKFEDDLYDLTVVKHDNKNPQLLVECNGSQLYYTIIDTKTYKVGVKRINRTKYISNVNPKKLKNIPTSKVDRVWFTVENNKVYCTFITQATEFKIELGDSDLVMTPNVKSIYSGRIFKSDIVKSIKFPFDVSFGNDNLLSIEWRDSTFEYEYVIAPIIETTYD